MGAPFYDANRIAQPGSPILNAWVAEQQAAREAKSKPSGGRRSFDAAVINRLTASWKSTSNSIDMELRSDLDRLRIRARDLASNNDYVRKFLQLVSVNVVGPNGFGLQARVSDQPQRPDTAANDAIELAFARWSRKGQCDVTGRMSFADLQRAIIMAVARDGEALIRIVRGKQAVNSFGYALQLLDIARLDTQFNQAATEGRNAVIMGIEVNEFGRPMAYHIFEAHPGGAQGGRKRQRIDAVDILHVFKTDLPEQTRGFPWMHSAMLRLHQLKGFEEAAIIAARVGAAKMGFFTTPDGQLDGLADDKDADGEYVTEAEPGTFAVLPNGVDFKPFDPDYPHQNYDAFVKACLRGIASGLGVAYHALANDLEGVNFSSIRSGTLEERDNWMTIQAWFVEAVLIPVFEDWLRMALLVQGIVLPNGSPLPVGKYDKFVEHLWQGRRWSWVDPLKDIQASKEAISAKLTSPQAVAAQMGADLEDVLVAINQANKLADEQGLPPFVSATVAVADSGASPVQSDDEEAKGK